MESEGYAIDETQVEFNHEVIDVGAFTVQKEKEFLYGFECAVGIESGGFYPTMAKNPNNKQLQTYRNQIIQRSHKANPYILCYRKLNNSE